MFGMGTLAYRTAKRAGLRVTDRTMGFIDTGHLDQAAVTRLLRYPLPGVTELLCHPADRSPELDHLLTEGYQWIAGYDFEGETAAVASAEVRDRVEKAGWQFSTFREFNLAG